MVYAFTAAFALSVSLMTTAARAETFAATAALVCFRLETGLVLLTFGRYVAVLVVFVSNGISGS
jgi:hypothetical protein